MPEEKKQRGRPKKLEQPNQEELQPFSIRMPKSLHKTLKLVCTARDTEMNEAVIEAVEVWLEQQPEYKKSKALGQASSNPK